jgi:hypothetical protein
MTNTNLKLTLMKMTLIIALTALTLSASAQKIKKSEIDKFTKEKRIETSDVILKLGMSQSMGARIRSVGNSYFIIFSGTGPGSGVIGSDDTMLFLLDNDSTITVKSTGIQDYQIYKYNSSYSHQYSIDPSQIQTISQHRVKSLRKYTAKGYIDFDLPEKKQGELEELCKVFLVELNKQ